MICHEFYTTFVITLYNTKIMGSEGLQERYINPYTDFGFKKLFGTDMNKDLLISFLNALPTRGANGKRHHVSEYRTSRYPRD